MGTKYLAENDDLSLWIQDRFERTATVDPVVDFMPISSLYNEYIGSDFYALMTKAEKRRVT